MDKQQLILANPQPFLALIEGIPSLLANNNLEQFAMIMSLLIA